MANTYDELMARRDGAVRCWIDADDRFAKLVRDGKTLARIDVIAFYPRHVQLTKYDPLWVGESSSWADALAWLEGVQRAAASVS